MRDRHEQTVERWLDEASFANELFQLHEKYDIEQGDEGYFAYRGYLRAQYENNLRTRGPTVAPLQEGCRCLFCRFNPDEITFEPVVPETAEATSCEKAESTEPTAAVQPTTPITSSPAETPVATKIRPVREAIQKPVLQLPLSHRPQPTGLEKNDTSQSLRPVAALLFRLANELLPPTAVHQEKSRKVRYADQIIAGNYRHGMD